MHIEALFITVKMWKQPQCPSKGEQIDKAWHIHMTECYPATERGAASPDRRGGTLTAHR